jgi:hypothetical protein
MLNLLVGFLTLVILPLLAAFALPSSGLKQLEGNAASDAAMSVLARQRAFSLLAVHQAAVVWAQAHGGAYGNNITASLTLPPAAKTTGLTAAYLSGVGVCTWQSDAVPDVSGMRVVEAANDMLPPPSWFTGYVHLGVYTSLGIQDNGSALGSPATMAAWRGAILSQTHSNSFANPCVTLNGVPNDGQYRALRYTYVP